MSRGLGDVYKRQPDALGEHDLGGVRRAERPALGKGATHGTDDGRMGMPEQVRPERADEVEITAPVGIPDARAPAADEDGRLAAHRVPGADRAVHAPRQDSVGTLPPASDVRMGQGCASTSQPAVSAARYVTMMSAPARAMAVSISSPAAARSRCPAVAAASIMATSPLTW